MNRDVVLYHMKQNKKALQRYIEEIKYSAPVQLYLDVGHSGVNMAAVNPPWDHGLLLVKHRVTADTHALSTYHELVYKVINHWSIDK